MTEPSDHIADVVADLSAQLDAAEAAELAAEVEDRTRREAALVSLVDRLRAAVLLTVTIDTAAGPITGVLTDAGVDWLQVEEGIGRSAIIPLGAVLSLKGLGRAAAPAGAGGLLAERLDLRHVLRGIARDRTSVRLSLGAGHTLVGVLESVGADYVEFTEHAQDERRRPAKSRNGRVVRLAAIVALRLG